MRLYRARPTSQRPRRHPPYLGKGPEHRVRGRWYTSELEDAKRHGQDNLSAEDWEIVVVEGTDEFADHFRVATTPRTKCGLTPIDFAIDPETEYVIPTWVAMDAQVIGANGKIRQRDYLFHPYSGTPLPFAKKDEISPKSDIVREYAEKNDIPVIDVKIAA